MTGIHIQEVAEVPNHNSPECYQRSNGTLGHNFVRLSMIYFAEV